MDIIIGRYQQQESGYKAFIPLPFLPSKPNLYGQPIIDIAKIQEWTHFTSAAAQKVKMMGPNIERYPNFFLVIGSVDR